MKKLLQFLGLLAIVAVVASASCLLTRTLFHPAGMDSHEWLHAQLGITADQERVLEPIEAKYARRKVELAAAIREANAELATVILEDKQSSPRVNAAIEKIHAAQGELQMVTLDHLFAMKPALTGEQFDKLLRLTADALESNSTENH